MSISVVECTFTANIPDPRFIDSQYPELQCIANGRLLPDLNYTSHALIKESQLRFILDLIKDGKEGEGISNMKEIIENCFKNSYRVSNYDFFPNYMQIIKSFETSAGVRDSIEQFQEVLPNILKTSTVGSTMLISDATRVNHESGFDPIKICRGKFKSFGTAASILDTATKTRVDEWFPRPGQRITFDSNFIYSLGLPPGMNWSCRGLAAPGSFHVSINYGNGNIIESDISRDDGLGDFTEYSKGNRLKNNDINDIWSTKTKIKTAEKCDQIQKIAITKELGDVAQIWMYYAYVMIEILLKNLNRIDALMITTDSVVYLLCIILFLPCVYTGSREGVQSGRCTLKHFLPGDIDYGKMYTNLIKAYYDHIYSNNNAIILALRIMSLDFNKFTYYRYYGDDESLRRTYGNYQTDEGKK